MSLPPMPLAFSCFIVWAAPALAGVVALTGVVDIAIAGPAGLFAGMGLSLAGLCCAGSYEQTMPRATVVDDRRADG